MLEPEKLDTVIVIEKPTLEERYVARRILAYTMSLILMPGTENRDCVLAMFSESDGCDPATLFRKALCDVAGVDDEKILDLTNDDVNFALELEDQEGMESMPGWKLRESQSHHERYYYEKYETQGPHKIRLTAPQDWQERFPTFEAGLYQAIMSDLCFN